MADIHHDLPRELRTADEAELPALLADGWTLAGPSVLRPGAWLLTKARVPDPTSRYTADQRNAFFAGAKPGGGAGPRLLNPEVARLVRRVGHTQMLLIADGGFPMPRGPETVDLSLSAGVPDIPAVLHAIAGDFAFDRIIAAAEMGDASPGRDAELRRLHPRVLHERPPHQSFKALAAMCTAAIRTGDATAYSNIILVGA